LGDWAWWWRGRGSAAQHHLKWRGENKREKRIRCAIDPSDDDDYDKRPPKDPQRTPQRALKQLEFQKNEAFPSNRMAKKSQIHLSNCWLWSKMARHCSNSHNTTRISQALRP